MTGWMQDLRSARRALTRRPALILAALLTLALGIGANSVIFSVVEAVLIHPLPYADADRLVYLQLEHRQGGMVYRMVPDVATVEAWRSQAGSFERIEGYRFEDRRLDDDEETVRAARVSAEMFPFLDVAPRVGRLFTDDEAGSEAPIVLLGHELWQRRYGGDPGVVGREVRLDGEPHTIVGVLPARVRGLEPDRRVHVWLPLAPGGAEQPLRPLARLRPGASPAAANDELDAVLEGFPEFETRQSRAVILSPRNRFGTLSTMVILIQGLVGCVLLIACSNVAHLMLALGEGRAREMAMRSVLGAGRLRLVRQLLVESLGLSLAGGVLGLLFAAWGLEALVALLPAQLAHLDHLAIRGEVVLFTLALAVLTGWLFGSVPAWRASAPDLEASLRESSGHGPPRRRRLLRRGLVALEVALSLALLAGAGAMAQVFVRWQNVGFGFDPDDLTILTLRLDEEPSRAPDRIEHLAPSLAGGGIAALAYANGMPGTLPDPTLARPEVEGRPADAVGQMFCPIVSISPGYFDALGIPLVAGEPFGAGAWAGAEEVAIVNEAMARALWGAEPAVGRRFRLGSDSWLRVVAVAADVRQVSPLFEISQPLVYRPFAQKPTAEIEIGLRPSATPELLEAELDARLVELDPAWTLTGRQSFEERVRGQLERNRFYTLLVTLFAAVAAVMACVGIYGVVSYTVSRRWREIAVRMAVGARVQAVFGQTLARGLTPVLAGTAFGIAASLALLRLLNAEVHPSIRTWDPGLLGLVVALVTVIALIAVAFPAQRVARVEPSVVLRHE